MACIALAAPLPDRPLKATPEEMRLARHGSTDQVAAYLQQHRSAYLAYARSRFSALADEAEDLVQEALMALCAGNMRTLRRFEGRTRLDGFIKRIIFKLGASDVRRRERRPTVPLDDALLAQYGAEDEGLSGVLAEATSRMLTKCLQEASPSQQRIVVLADAGYGSAEIAVLERITVDQVHAVLAHVRKGVGKLTGERG